jgi:hypothetical protein
MFAFFAHSKYMPCPACGAALGVEEPDEHVCDERRRIDFEMFRLRGRVARFELTWASFWPLLPGASRPGTRSGSASPRSYFSLSAGMLQSV